MKPAGSSTSSSERPSSAWVETLGIGAWIVFWLAAFDVGINVIFGYPDRPDVDRPNEFQTYFEWGRSAEGKIRRFEGRYRRSPSLAAGWLSPEGSQGKPRVPDSGDDLLVAVYGMSYSNHIAEAIEEVNPQVTLRLVHTSAAAPNWAYAAYQYDRPHHQADVVVLGILASSVRGMATQSSLTWRERQAYTYPTYAVGLDGKPHPQWPTVRDLDDLAVAMEHPARWEAFLDGLSQHDRFYHPLLVRASVLDESAIVRLARRAFFYANRDRVSRRFHRTDGFVDDSQAAVALRAVAREFCATAVEDGRLPILLLLNNRGYDDHLYRLLEPMLREENLPYVSTHDICPSTDVGNLAADGAHFNHEANRRVARAVLDLIGGRAGPDGPIERPLVTAAKPRLARSASDEGE